MIQRKLQLVTSSLKSVSPLNHTAEADSTHKSNFLFAIAVTTIVVTTLVMTATAPQANAETIANETSVPSTGKTAKDILEKQEPSAAGADSWLFEEPLAQSRDPHFFDWWSSRFDVELGANAVNESNNFKSQSYSLGLMYGLSNTIAIRGAYRQVSVSGSASSDVVGQTPYAQAAQSARSELMLGIVVPLLAGRSFTLISPWLGDLNHVLSFVAGAHYSFYPSLAHPFGGHAPDPLSGQTPITYKYAGEIGLQMKVGLPHSLSAFVEFDYLIPLIGRNPDLPNWTTLGGGLAWSFAD